jgi:hypothetical protein
MLTLRTRRNLRLFPLLACVALFTAVVVSNWPLSTLAIIGIAALFVVVILFSLFTASRGGLTAFSLLPLWTPPKPKA